MPLYVLRTTEIQHQAVIRIEDDGREELLAVIPDLALAEVCLDAIEEYESGHPFRLVITWTTADILKLRPDLTEAQAEELLRLFAQTDLGLTGLTEAAVFRQARELHGPARIPSR